MQAMSQEDAEAFSGFLKKLEFSEMNTYLWIVIACGLGAALLALWP